MVKINMDAEVFTYNVFSKAYRTLTRRQIFYLLDSLVRGNELIRLKKGFYCKSGADKYKVAVSIYEGYISFSSALYLQGLKSEVENTVFVCTKNWNKAIEFGGVKIIPVSVSNFFYGTSPINGILTATFPKIIADMFYRPKYASYFDMYRAINLRKLKEKEWEELYLYLKDSNISTIRRAGYSLESMAPGWFTRKLREIAVKSGGVSSFFRKKGRFIREWRLYNDINIKRFENEI